MSSGDLAGEAATIGVIRHPGVDVVTVTGDFDVAHHQDVRRLMADTHRVAQSEVVLDLTGVTFLDAKGIGTLVFCRRVLAARAARMSLVSPDGRTRQLLRIVALDRVLPIYPTVPAALAALVVG